MHFMVRRNSAVILFLVTILTGAFESYAQTAEDESVIVIGGLVVSQEAPGALEEEEQQEETLPGKEETLPDQEGALPEGEDGRFQASDVRDTEQGKAEVSCGIFEITGYCACEICTGGGNLTYSGTVPEAGHTVAADLSVFPLGTRLRIGDCFYTVEDTGKSIKGKEIDIFYDTHEEAAESGRYKEEVFRLNTSA